MKHLAFIMLAIFLMTGIVSCDKNKKDPEPEAFNTTVEELITQDEAYFANMAGKVVFFESRIVMPKPFNESDKLIAQEVTNVFQQTIETKDGGFETTVYMFTHQLNEAETNIDIRKGAFVLDDKPIDMDSIKLTFDKAFRNARMSNYTPSKSRYITLRHAIGPKACNAFFTIGNDTYGHLWVDAVDGTVTDVCPDK